MIDTHFVKRLPAVTWLLASLMALDLVSGVIACAADPSSDPLVIRFVREPRCQSQVVRLSDLVEVVAGAESNDADLLEMPLAPAPRPGKSQDWTADDVLRHLQLRGVDIGRVRWSGAQTAQLTRLDGTDDPAHPTALSPAFVQDRTLEQAETQVAQAIREYLWLKTGERTAWRITVDIPLEHALGLTARRNIESIGGGEPPWEGTHTLTLSYKHQGKQLKARLKVQVELPAMVVTAARPMRRDEVITEEALQYSPLPDRLADQSAEYYTDFQQIVGKQLRRSVSTGLPIAQSNIGEPIVVSSGELVEVESVAASISVKTAGRALTGGAVGDLVNIELIPTRQRMTATVVGPLQVRVAGAATPARSSPRDSESSLSQKANKP